jgi:hypothetical protein
VTCELALRPDLRPSRPPIEELASIKPAGLVTSISTPEGMPVLAKKSRPLSQAFRALALFRAALSFQAIVFSAASAISINLCANSTKTKSAVFALKGTSSKGR